MFLEQKNFVFRASLDQKFDKTLMHEPCSPKLKNIQMTSAPEKFYKESLSWILLLPNRWQILSKIPSMHY